MRTKFFTAFLSLMLVLSFVIYGTDWTPSAMAQDDATEEATEEAMDEGMDAEEPADEEAMDEEGMDEEAMDEEGMDEEEPADEEIEAPVAPEGAEAYEEGTDPALDELAQLVADEIVTEFDEDVDVEVEIYTFPEEEEIALEDVVAVYEEELMAAGWEIDPEMVVTEEVSDTIINVWSMENVAFYLQYIPASEDTDYMTILVTALITPAELSFEGAVPYEYGMDEHVDTLLDNIALEVMDVEGSEVTGYVLPDGSLLITTIIPAHTDEEGMMDEEAMDEEYADEEAADEETMDEEAADEEGMDEEAVDEEAADEEPEAEATEESE